MAHQITDTDGLVLAGEKAWHGLGIVLPTRCDAITAMKTAGLEWEVEVSPFTINMQDGEGVDSGDYRAVVRRDTRDVFATCKKGYRPIQNRDLFDLAYEISAFSDRAVEAAGSLRGGRRVFCLLAMDTIAAAADDMIQPYLFIGAGHDLGMPVTLGATVTRTVCANTVAIALNEMGDNCLRIKHTQSSEQRMSMIEQWLGNPMRAINDYEQTARRMAETEITNDQLQAYFTSVWQRINGKLIVTEKGKSRREMKYETEVAQWLQNFREDPRQTGVSTSGTVWSAVNAVTQWANHERTVRNADEDSTKRLDSVLFGSGHRVNMAAHDAAMALVA